MIQPANCLFIHSIVHFTAHTTEIGLVNKMFQFEVDEPDSSSLKDPFLGKYGTLFS